MKCGVRKTITIELEDDREVFLMMAILTYAKKYENSYAGKETTGGGPPVVAISSANRNAIGQMIESLMIELRR